MYLTVEDVGDIARGTAFLGAGGGGDPYYAHLLVKQALQEGCQIELLDPDDLADDALVIPSAMMGAPTVLLEKLPGGDEILLSVRRLEDHLGQTAVATMPIECGGINGLVPLVVGAHLGLPVVDADGMGRAFPELQMETFHVHGVSGTPMVLTNEYGDSVLITTHNNEMMEWLARGITIRMGGVAYIAEYPMDGATVKRTAVPRTLSLSLTIGRCLRMALDQAIDPFTALSQHLKTTPYHFSHVIFEGKVIDVLRQTTTGFAKGKAFIEAATDSRRHLEVVFQNEYLLAREKDRVRAMVPDLICVLDSRTAQPIATETIRYGQQVKVMAVSAPEMLRTSEALAVFGPQVFGFKQTFCPVEQLCQE
ncbi:MAG: DUF917 domain-containing protein [Chloroflexota bacterium]